MATKKPDKEFEAWAKRWKLDEEEREILLSHERGEWKPVPNQKKEIARYRVYARHTLEKMRKSESISIRFAPDVLHAIKAQAAEEGIPYQTLITSLAYKYVRGKKIA